MVIEHVLGWISLMLRGIILSLRDSGFSASKLKLAYHSRIAHHQMRSKIKSPFDQLSLYYMIHISYPVKQSYTSSAGSHYQRREGFFCRQCNRHNGPYIILRHWGILSISLRSSLRAADNEGRLSYYSDYVSFPASCKPMQWSSRTDRMVASVTILDCSVDTEENNNV